MAPELRQVPPLSALKINSRRGCTICMFVSVITVALLWTTLTTVTSYQSVFHHQGRFQEEIDRGRMNGTRKMW